MSTPPRDSAIRRACATAALVCAGCYLGARAEAWLQFPGVGAAIVFPPYAIVTAALLRSRPRIWWAILLAASVGDFVPHRQLGASVSFALLAELVNHLRAVLAAIALRRSWRRPGRFDTLGEVVAFLVFAVFLAPCVAAFAGAALMLAHGSPHPFWLMWQEWALSNAITGLALLPVLMIELHQVGARKWLATHRIGEASLLLGGLVAVGAGVFVTSYCGIGLHPARLYWPLPFLLWAAVRFGPRGTSAALLAVTCLSIWGAIQQRGPFVAQPPVDNLLELQLFLLAVSVPLLLLSVLLRQQRRTAADLAESRRQYRSVVEDQTEMICRFRPDGTYTFVNAAYASAFGRDPAELAGGNIWQLTPAGAHRSPRELAADVTPDCPAATREAEVTVRPGQVRWQHWRDRGFFDERGAVVEYQAVGQDITDRKRAEDERRELEAQRSVEAVLREADRRKDEFLAMLGHELRNPLAPIGFALEIMRHAPGDSAEAEWAREAIGRQLLHLKRLVDDLLDISRVTLGKIRLQIEAVDLSQVMASALETARPLIDSFGHEVTMVLPVAPVRVRADAVRLTQVLSNLLNNAAKYTKPGGRIRIAARGGPDGVEISVQDNGVGIAEEALGRIFELFAQLPGPHEGAEGGLGIGLTLVRRIVELHGGTVEARSAGLEQGTEIVVRLPAPADEVAARAPDPPSVAASQPVSLRILAVDDNADVTHGLASILGLWGHSVRTALDGESALEVAAAFSPDVVLLDLGLPRLDGVEVARRLRRTAVPAPVLFVSMSGVGQELTRARSSAGDFHHHLVKPVDVESLRALLDGCFPNARAR